MTCLKEDTHKAGIFPWADQWSWCGEKVWFISGNDGILYRYNATDMLLEQVSLIPDDGMIRSYELCFEYDGTIFCLPYLAKDILIYNYEKDNWERAILSVAGDEQLRISSFIIKDSILYMWSMQRAAVFLFDLDSKQIVSEFKIECDKDELVSRGFFADDSLFVCSSKNKIFKIVLGNGNVEKICCEDIDDKLMQLAVWNNCVFLSGMKRKIYKYDNGMLDIYDEFPKDFGIYNFDGKLQKKVDYNIQEYDVGCFLYIAVTEDKVWFIPFKTNLIVYYDSKDCEIKRFHVENEDQSEDCLGEQLLHHKYLLLYVKDNRFIGLYSLRNKQVFEIDSKENTYMYYEIHSLEKKEGIEELVSWRVKKKNLINEESGFSVKEMISAMCYESRLLD